MDPTFLGTVALPPLPWKSRVSKSNAHSALCRKSGNTVLIKTAAYDFALKAYNASLCYAPPGSEDIPLLYGNRSALYCMIGEYALAIENIRLARENGFPAEKMAKLIAREEKCKNLLEKAAREHKFDVNSFLKLSHPPNPKIPFIVDCLELRKTEKYGRGVYATQDLKTGGEVYCESVST